MRDPGLCLLELLWAWAASDQAGAFDHTVTIGVRTQDGFRYWTYRPTGLQSSLQTTQQAPEDTQVMVGLSHRYARALMHAEALPAPGIVHVSGDPHIWHAFVQRFIGGYDGMSLRGALAAGGPVYSAQVRLGQPTQ